VANEMVPVSRSSSLLRGWDPLREFDDLHERFTQLVNSVFGAPAASSRGFGLPWTPLADVTETEDAYLVEVDLPGVKREDIAVETFGSELVISGEFKQKERAGEPRSQTRRRGRFEYRATLPAQVNTDQISAELADGILMVRVPKTEAAKPRRIEITGG
jgi:HSP20 family protein